MGEDNRPAEGGLFNWFNEIHIIAQLSGALFEQALPHGLKPNQFAVLNWFVRVDDVATPARLARAFQVTRGAMTNTLARLRDKDFVSVVPDPANGRSKQVRLTSAGAAAREDAMMAAGPLLAEFARALDSAVLEQQLPDLRHVREWLDERRFRVD